MKSFSLASGSSGNAIYVESEEGTNVLIDCGLSFSKTKEILLSKNIDIFSLDAVLLTHEHSDHCLGLSSFLSKLDCKYYMSKGTYKALNLKQKENIDFVKHHQFFSIKDMKIFSIDKPHDAEEALAFVVSADNSKLGVFTDLGHVSDEIKHLLKTLDIIYFEANYCEKIIESSSLNIKYLNRLVSNVGHLGLSQTIEVLKETTHNDQTIILSHISENTNSYENTYVKVKSALEEANKTPKLLVSFQGEASEWVGYQ